MTTPEHCADARRVLTPASLRRRPVERRLALFAAALCLFAPAVASLIPTAAAEQKPYALIFGTVFTAEGRLVYGVPVKVRRADKKKPLLEAMSDHNGEFAFRVPPGPADYLVWLDIKQPKDRKNDKPAVKDPLGVTSQTTGGVEVKVHVDGDERVDISLHLPESAKPY